MNVSPIPVKAALDLLTSGLYAIGAILKPIPVRLAPLPAYDVADTIPLALTPPELIVIFDATTDDVAVITPAVILPLAKSPTNLLLLLVTIPVALIPPALIVALPTTA